MTLSREMFGPDVPASVTTTSCGSWCDGVRFIERMLANPVDKDARRRRSRAAARSCSRKSVVALRRSAGRHRARADAPRR